MRPWCSFRVELDTERRYMFVADTFACSVVEVQVGDFDILVAAKRIDIDTKPVILNGYHDFAGLEILYRVVGAMMAKFQFVCLSTQSQTEHLMAQANTKQWNLAQQTTDRFDRIADRSRISRAIG